LSLACFQAAAKAPAAPSNNDQGCRCLQPHKAYPPRATSVVGRGYYLVQPASPARQGAASSGSVQRIWHCHQRQRAMLLHIYIFKI